MNSLPGITIDSKANAFSIEIMDSSGNRSCMSAGVFWQLVHKVSSGLSSRLGAGNNRLMVCAHLSVEALAVIVAGFRMGAEIVLQPLPLVTTELVRQINMYSPGLVYMDQAQPVAPGELRPGTGVSVLDRAWLGQLQSATERKCITDGESVLQVQTSGSGGKPKVIKYSADRLSAFMQAHHTVFRQYFDDEPPESPLISVFPFSHLAGLALPLEAMHMGRKIVLVESLEPVSFLELVADTKTHFIALASSMYPGLLQQKTLIEQLELGRLRYCICLGERAVDNLADLIRERFKALAISAYGLTECLPGLAHSKQDLHKGQIPESACGKNFFGELKLRDEQGAPAKNFGRLCIRNKTVQPCYTDAQLNYSSFEDGWLLTNDLFYRDAKGYFYHRGRADKLFTWHGKTIAPEDVEQLALSHPRVTKACCVPVENQDHVVVPGLVVQGSDCAEEELINYLLVQGKPHLVPGKILSLAHIPCIGPGKIDRQYCRTVLEQYVQKSPDSFCIA